MAPEHQFDVIIIGAGMSGINAAYHIQNQLPGHTFAILEARDDLGGTWDLFKYPGIRSDSDLFTFGFAFNPWKHHLPIAEGAAIKNYIHNTAHNYAIDKHILFRHRLLSANWLSTKNLWSLSVDHNCVDETYTTRFMILATGYYDHREPLRSHIPGLDNFEGQIVHPQFWPENLDYRNRKIVIIGSGSTAITLLPTLADQASCVTMLQRSPTYILSLPNYSSRWLLFLLPWTVYHCLQRTIWVHTLRIFFLFCRWFPNLSRWLLKLSVQVQLPNHITYDPHFNPRYKPWDQRVCISPDGDFFHSLRTGKADIRTDIINTTTASGITLSSGEALAADIIILATGLKMQIAGGSTISLDDKNFNMEEKYVWNGVMLQDLPNAAFLLGYVNTSWTLGVDVATQSICRLLKTLESRKLVGAVPRLNDASFLSKRRLFDLSSTYLTVADSRLPKVADQEPWQPRDHYAKDLEIALYGNIDTCLEFIRDPNLHSKAKSS